MGAPKGHPRYGGRRAGTPNKNTQALVDRAKEMGLDIWEAMVQLAQEAEGPERFAMLARMAEYAYPKRKAVEHSGQTKQLQTLEILRPDGSGIAIQEKSDDDN